MPIPAFSDVVGHEKILTILEHAAKRPAPGYLLSGPDGVGKRTVALKFARVLLGQPEGSLESHPDFMRMEREEGDKDISVERVREVIKRMQMTSARGGFRITLIEQADQLNEAGVNALLKVVEEASSGVVFLFITEQPDALPATLRSRLVLVPFSRVSESELRPWLERLETDRIRTDRALRVARGCPGIAKRYLEDPETWESQLSDAERLLKVLQTQKIGVRIGALERTARQLESSEDTEAAWRWLLTLCMQTLEPSLREQPRQNLDLALGLIHAWRLSGTTLSPRLALEWAGVRSFFPPQRTFSSFLHPSYL